ncbi:MAG TPA: PAS domain S-box protein [Prosthecobacter sp.]
MSESPFPPPPAEIGPAHFGSPEHLLSAIVDSSDDAIISKNLRGIVTSWNRGAERLFGYTAEEMVGQSIMRLFPPGRQDEEPRILQQIQRGERVEHFDTQRVTKDGRLIEVSLSISPVRNAEGDIVGASKIARDITTRKMWEEGMLVSRRKLEVLNRTGTAITAEHDMEKLVQAVTDAGREISGAAFGAFFYTVKRPDQEAFMLYTLSGAPREAFEKFGMPRNTPIFAPTFGGEGSVRIGNVRKDPRYGHMPPHHGMPAGHLPVVSYLAVPVVSMSGEVIGGLFYGHPEPDMFTEESEMFVKALGAQAAVAMDNARLYADLQERLEEQRKAQEQARLSAEEATRQSRMKDEFLATLSHELRTPLQSILGWTQLLLSEECDAEEVKQGIEVIDRNANAQTRIIEDLLDMSRILSGKVRLDVQRVELADLIKAAVESVRPAAQGKNIKLQTVLDPLAQPVSGDPNRLQQIFWNLLSNAIKFTPAGGKVQILLERVNSHLEVSVTDTGMGISAEFLPYVFERFRQADASTTRRHGGLGLGLAIVKNLAELHGGGVRAKSPGKDRGTTFTIVLPVVVLHSDPAHQDERVHPAADGSGTAASPLPRLEKLSVLVVDDEEDARNLLALVLTKAGASVRTAGSVKQALQLWQEAVPQVLISDIGMPGEDGYALIRAIRALPESQGRHVPAIALTAYTRTEDRIKAIAAGFQMHISKPADGLELLTMVSSLTSKGTA